MQDVFQRIRNGLIVSCQSEGDSPFNSPEGVAMFARAAAAAGAAGIRSEGIVKTQRIIDAVALPVIGLIKSSFDDGSVRITGSKADVEGLVAIGATIIAIDGTFRTREGLSGPAFIAKVKQEHDCVVMADIATLEEGIACAAAGADCLSTTLSGYTPETWGVRATPDFDLLAELVKHVRIPVIAEGRITTPEAAAKMKALGAWSIVVGSAITRPGEITKWFIQALQD